MKKINMVLVLVCAVFAAGCGSPASPQNAIKEPAATSAPMTTIDNSGQVAREYSLNDAYATEAEAPAYEAAPAPYEQDYYEIPNTEEYLAINENSLVNTRDNSMLTFSLKVDTASYRNTVRYIESGNLPPSDAVRTEEFINYFKYDGQMPVSDGPFSIYAEIGDSIFDSNKHLAFIRVKAKDIDRRDLAPSNLTFLIDTSGSMNSYDKLPLLQSAFGLLAETLTEDDTVSIVTYAGSSAVVLDSVSGDRVSEIKNAINRLESGGSTAGGEGIITAYALAEKNFRPKANNRVILATDGDFNVGVSTTSELEKLISTKRESGVYLSILGFGMGNLKDNMMETLAKYGNGNYSYIDSLSEAKKVLVDELTSNLYTIADDVKAQVEFNPALVSSYRLIGYENRALDNRDFENDKKDAGEIGVGTDVVLLFELELGNKNQGLKYQTQEPQPERGDFIDELFEVRIRYKDPGVSVSKLITLPVKTERILDHNTTDFNFASAVAGFAHLLRNSEYAGDITINQIIAQAEDNLGKDYDGYRHEFVNIAKMVKNMVY